jgi:putative ABC transport system permease protein
VIRLALAQMRRSLPRLVSAGIAVAIGTAFVAATLVAGNVITRTTYDSMVASLAQADLVVRGSELTPDTLAAVRATDGVAAADGRVALWTELAAGGQRAYPEVTTRASDPRLEAQQVRSGRLPDAPGEIALPASLADRLDLAVGDEVRTVRTTWDPETGEPSESTESLAVVGLTEDPSGAFARTGGAAVVHPDDAARWYDQEWGGEGLAYDAIVVALEPQADLEAARAALADAAPGTVVQTRDERAQQLTAELTGDTEALTAVVLGFAAIALLVAALVVTNTFQVLVAQRTRTLALLRCVGADKRQVRRSVLVEAALLGAAASAAGIAVGLALAQVTLLVLGNVNPDVPLPTTVPVSAAVLAVPFAVGTVVTLVAALAPARAATRVAPLAALRPADAPVLGTRASRGRLALALLLTVGGGGLLVGGVALSGSEGGVMVGLPVGLLGGALSFVGVLVGALLWIPPVVALAGRLLARTGPSARLAAANTLRNPRRTSATSAALLIGVTLVAMMSTGAASARTTLASELDAQFPVDVVVRDPNLGATDPSATPQITSDVVSRLAAVEGVEAVAHSRVVTVAWADDEGDLGWEELQVLPPDTARNVLLDPAQADGLADDTVVVTRALAERYGLADGDPVTLAVDGGPGTEVTRDVVVTDFAGALLATPTTLGALGVDLPTNELWLRLAADADTVAVMDDVQEALSDSALQVFGVALERAMFENVIDTLLAIVLGLLAAAVVIALIGVANTLSLSVIERRRESATLRAIGMSRAQLRGSLAVEGMLVAVVGAVLGSALGLVYGWAGTLTVLRALGDVALELPWRELGAVLAVAVAAGLLASVLPARSAVRTSPVEALAVE